MTFDTQSASRGWANGDEDRALASRRHWRQRQLSHTAAAPANVLETTSACIFVPFSGQRSGLPGNALGRAQLG
jgi:hypothetical protein